MKRHQTIIDSFFNAFSGIGETFRTERNIKIQAVVGFFVLVLSFLLRLNPIELIVIMITVGLVLALEMINTAIETLSDEVDLNYNKSIKKVKDASAGAVLIFSMFSIIVGILIFTPKLVNFL